MNCFDCNAISGLIMDAILIEHSLIITNNLCENGWHFLYNKSIPINQIKKILSINHGRFTTGHSLCVQSLFDSK